jgi:D-lactate dehydrogenase
LSQNQLSPLDVCFYEAFEEEEAALKKYLPDSINAEFTWKTIQESGHSEPVAPIISTRTQSKLPPEWSGKLTAILSRSTGFDHLIRYYNETGTKTSFGYLPLYCNRAVAEQAMLLWMSLLRRLPRQLKQFQEFDRDGLTGLECEHKTLLVAGVGNIGYEVIKIGRGLGMQVFGVDIVQKHSDVNYINKAAGIVKADVVVCAMNLTKDNYGYFDYEFLKHGKKGIIFVNIARGEMSPVEDLLRLMNEKHLGGLALDVYENEVNLAHHLRNKSISESAEMDVIQKLSEFENVIMTPHNAFNTSESVERKAEQSIRQIEHFLKNRSFIWPVNLI